MAAAALSHSLSLLLIALVVDAVLGWLPGLREVLRAPADAITVLAAWLDRRLNRERRSPSTRFMRGLIVALVIAAAGWGIGWLVRNFAATGPEPESSVVEAAAILLLIRERAPFDLARGIARHMGADDFGAARSAIEDLAIGFAGVVGGAFWYLLLGLPGLCLYRAVQVTARRIARPGVVFGRGAAALNAALDVIPATIAGLLIALAAVFAPRGRPLHALAVMCRDRTKHPTWNTGAAMPAMAGALGFALGGGPWIGDGRARLVAQDVRSASYLYAVACLIHMGLIAGAFAALSPYSPI